MLALHRCGRTADALDQFHRTRRVLADELGIDASTTLRTLHDRILAADHELTPAAEPAMPRQLPGPPRTFTGRADALARLTAGTTSVITGAGGVGKTWLALQWAHRHRDDFPDGQLFVNLRGFDPVDQPLPAEVAVSGFLQALGVAFDAIPVDPQARTGLYRGLLTGRRMLIVLDNAADSDHVTPLLPGNPDCTVIVTSRRRLGGLLTAHGAVPVNLDVLDPADARNLLTRHIGADRVAGEPDATTELLRQCAGLPLALAIVAARASGRPDLPLSALSEELDDARLDALDAGDLSASLRGVFESSYRALAPDAAAMFELLGLTRASDIGVAAAASLAGTSRAKAILNQLEDAHLIQQYTAGRYRMHDLVRLYAADLAQRHDPPAREAALNRLIDHYLHAAGTADRILRPHRPAVEFGEPTAGTRLPPLRDTAAAMAWFDLEHSSLFAIQRLAADHGRHDAVWRLAWAMTSYQNKQGRFHDELAAWDYALNAAQHLPDDTQALIHRSLGRAYAHTGLHVESLTHLHHALTHAERTGDPLTLAHTHQALAAAWERQGQYGPALDHALQQLELYRTQDNPVWEADALNLVGWLHALLTQYAEAEPYCRAALELYSQHDDLDGEAMALDSLGYLAHNTGEHATAIDYYQQALRIYREIGNIANEANTLDRLGHTNAALGHFVDTCAAWRQALALYQGQHRTRDAVRVQEQLDRLSWSPVVSGRA